MKNIILLLSAILVFASCRGERDFHTQMKKRSLVSHSSAMYQPATFRNILRQFDFNPSAIYGDVFTNKAWN